MKYILWALLVSLLLTNYAYAETSLDDLSGLPSGSELLVTEPTVTNEPAPVAATPAPVAAETGPGDIILVVGGIAMLGFILVKFRPAKHARL
jgi:hypothetical protein